MAFRNAALDRAQHVGEAGVTLRHAPDAGIDAGGDRLRRQNAEDHALLVDVLAGVVDVDDQTRHLKLAAA